MQGGPRPADCSYLFGDSLFVCLLAAFFFALLLDLARKLAAATEQLTRQGRADTQNLAADDAQLLLAAGPLADELDLLGRQRLAVHDAALGLNLVILLSFNDLDDFLGER